MTDAAVVLPMRWRPTIGLPARLRAVRLDYAERIGHRVTQDEMAELVGVKPGTYRSWEAGNSRPADLIETAQRIFRVTGADPAWLLGVGDEIDPDAGPEGTRDLGNALDRCGMQSPVRHLASVA